jgi:hypothetical protein
LTLFGIGPNPPPHGVTATDETAATKLAKITKIPFISPGDFFQIVKIFTEWGDSLSRRSFYDQEFVNNSKRGPEKVGKFHLKSMIESQSNGKA